jgi:membrane-bound lytic murein transglycosylase D
MHVVAGRLSFVLVPLLALLMGGCAGTDIKSTATFPVPEEIRPNVDFWRNVYGEWSRSQVAIHDDEHMGLVYEVVDLPGEIRGGYTPEQKRLLNQREASYRSRLAGLESKVRAGQSLRGGDRELYDRIADAAGRSAVYGAAQRVRLQRGVRERFRRGLEISGRYDRHFREIFRERGLPEDLAYLPHVESSFQVNARSSVGAAGVWQFMPATGRVYDMKVNGSIDERLDPVVAAEGAARYLGDAHGRLGNWPLAVTSYNHGQGGMQRAKRLHGDDIGRIVRDYKGRAFGFSSRNFYASFIAAREVAGNYKRYFPEGVAFEPPLPHDQLVLRHSTPAYHLARHYGTSVYQLKEMNLAWRDPIIEGRSQIPAGTKVWLPAGSVGRAGEPSPVPSYAAVASSEPRVAPARVAVKPPRGPVVAKAEVRVQPAVAKAKPSAKPVVAKVEPKSKPKPAPKVHVVKPNETLYRVALRYEMTVDELKKLNRMKRDDDTIRAGQRLRVSG